MSTVLVQLLMADGESVWVNPEHVVAVIDLEASYTQLWLLGITPLQMEHRAADIVKTIADAVNRANLIEDDDSDHWRFDTYRGDSISVRATHIPSGVSVGVGGPGISALEAKSRAIQEVRDELRRRDWKPS